MPEFLSKIEFWMAFIAAVASLIAANNSTKEQKDLKSQVALRKILAPKLDKIGNLFYRLVAESKSMIDAKNDLNFLKFREKLQGTKREINQLRSEVRYSLYGLDSAIERLNSVPYYLVHFKNDRKNPSAGKIIELATELRIILDRAVMETYRNGESPSSMAIADANHAAVKLERHFAKTSPRSKVTPATAPAPVRYNPPPESPGHN